MIAENNYLIPQEVKRTYAKEHGLILIATDLDKEEIPQGKDIIIGEVEKNQTILSEKITEVEGNINERLSALEETLNDIKSKNDKFESLEEKLGQIMALLQKD
jgi:ubiquinone biosynthesis protein UbiJ